MTAFSVFSHRTWAVLFIDVIFAAVGYWKVGPAILVVCWKFVRLHYARLRFVSPQEHLYPHCFGTVSISSAPFHFFLSENHLKTILTRFPQKLQTLVLCSGNTSLTFKWLGIQYWDYTKRNTKTDSGSERLRLTQVLLKTQNRAYSGQENKLQNGSRNIYDHFLPPSNFCMLTI